jgi:acyl-CoA synthetase (AMP-forming)/AMP-acid ligase II
MINRGGLKVFPGEVEEVIRLSPQIADAAVVGVPDDRLGEVPWAFVVLHPGAILEPAALTAAAREKLLPYKVPVRFVQLDELPRTEVGKVRAADLVRIATEPASS